MIAWEPRVTQGGGEWHLAHDYEPRQTLCGAPVTPHSAQRDPHKVDHYNATRCKKCWMEWKLESAGRLAAQDQYLAKEQS